MEKMSQNINASFHGVPMNFESLKKMAPLCTVCAPVPSSHMKYVSMGSASGTVIFTSTLRRGDNASAILRGLVKLESENRIITDKFFLVLAVSRLSSVLLKAERVISFIAFLLV